MNISRNTPLVTVLIDNYNYGQFIGEAIDSALNQTFPLNDMEIIIVDDGSTDKTQEKVKKYKDKIKYIYKENGGQASALNVGFEKCQGQYIILLDADDLMVPTRVEKVVLEFERYEDVGCILNRRIIVSDNNKEYDKFSYFNNLRLSDDNIDLISGSAYGTSRTSFRKSMLKNIFPLPEIGLKIEADLYFNLAALWFTNISSLEDYLSIYRIHGKNLYSVSDVQRLPLQIESMSCALDYVKEKAKESAYYNPKLLNELIKPYEIHLKYKKISYNSQIGKERRWNLFLLEIDRLRYYWKKWSMLYKIYKIITIPLTLIMSSENYLDLKDKYYNKKVYKIRESVFPNK